MATAGTLAVPPLLRSPLTSIHASLGAVISTEAGAEVVRSYADPAAERSIVGGAVGIADVTVRGKIDVRGSVGPLVGSAGVSRIADDWILLLLSPGPVVERVVALRSAVGDRAMVTDVTHLYAGFALAGPGVYDLVARLTSWDPSTLAIGEATGAPIVDVRSVVVRREAAVPAIEIYVAMEFARYVWRSLLAAATPLGGRPVGWDALLAEGWR